MEETTISLPASLKRQLEHVARIEGRSEAEIIRQAIEDAVRAYDPGSEPPAPRLPLTTRGLGRPDIAERLDEFMKGFGED